jgi:D-alanyl-D-alanine carboxypeptidase
VEIFYYIQKSAKALSLHSSSSMNKKTKTTLRILAVLVTITSLIIFVPWSWVKLQLLPASETIDEELARGLEEGFVGMIAYVEIGGKIPAIYTAGYDNLEKEQLMTEKTLFKIASISKLYIAAAVTKLVGEGKLQTDQTLAELHPQIAETIENADQITLKMLVQHRSGIPNFVDDEEWDWSNPPETLEDYYPFTLNRGSDFEPNTRYAYSNTNYLFLGAIMDRLLGYSHHRYIQETFLDPLGLQNTYHTMNEAGEDNVSSGYFVGYEPDIRSQNYLSPGGSMVATISDVGTFQRSLVEGTFFTNEEQLLYKELYSYDHTGLLPGYQSIARYHPEMDAIIILFMNKGGGNLWMTGEAIYDRITKIVAK